MSNPEIEIIKNFILPKDEELSKNRFAIAWAVHQNFEEIKLQLKREMLKELKNRLKDAFGNGWKIEEDKIEDLGKFAYLMIYKDSWKDMIGYAIQSDEQGFLNPYFGMARKDEDAEYEKRRNEDKIIANVRGIFPNCNEPNKWWICTQSADCYKGMVDKDFCLELLTKSGKEKFIKYFVENLLKLQKATEKLLDDWVKDK